MAGFMRFTTRTGGEVWVNLSEIKAIGDVEGKAAIDMGDRVLQVEEDTAYFLRQMSRPAAPAPQSNNGAQGGDAVES